jgi:hypothetical protein
VLTINPETNYSLRKEQFIEANNVWKAVDMLPINSKDGKQMYIVVCTYTPQ